MIKNKSGPGGLRSLDLRLSSPPFLSEGTGPLKNSSWLVGQYKTKATVKNTVNYTKKHSDNKRSKPAILNLGAQPLLRKLPMFNNLSGNRKNVVIGLDNRE